MAGLTVMLVTVLGGVVVAVTRKPDDSGGASSLRCRDNSLLRFAHSTTRNSLNTNGITDGLFLSEFIGRNYRENIFVRNYRPNYGRKVRITEKRAGT